MTHLVDVTLSKVARPAAASVLVKSVNPVPAQKRESVVIVIDIDADVTSLTIVIAVPIGNATELFAGIV